eukprot:gene28745-31924_t
MILAVIDNVAFRNIMRSCAKMWPCGALRTFLSLWPPRPGPQLFFSLVQSIKLTVAEGLESLVAGTKPESGRSSSDFFRYSSHLSTQ